MSLNGSRSTLTGSESTLIGSNSLTGSESTLTGSHSTLNGPNECHANLNGSTKSSNGSKSIVNGSVKSFNGSHSTLNGSVKSSKSSGTYFGSCHSSTSIGTFKTIGSSETIGTYQTIGSSETIGTFKTAKSSETIGSFRTAHSGSLSTIYFSTKSYNADDEPDSNTLNWTMNYNSFDELSDTSTLIGDHPETEELREDTYLQNLCQTTEESSGSKMTLNELEELSGTVTTAESENSVELNQSYQTLHDNNQQPKRPEIITILEKDTILNLCLILTASVISVSIHLIFAYAQVTTTTWILIFWRAILQITISTGILIWTLKSRRDRLKNINLRMHLMIGFLGFISIMFWLDISQKNLLTSGTSSIAYFVIPIIVLIVETIVKRQTPFNLASSIAILLLWSSALLTFSTQLDSQIPWQIYSLDPTFAWPIPLGDQIKEDVLLGHVLSTFAIAATVSYLLVISFDNGFGWASIMLLQGLGGLFASLIGKFDSFQTRFWICIPCSFFVGLITFDKWTPWSQMSFYPIPFAILGTISNGVMIKVLRKSSPSLCLFGKSAIEALVLFFIHANSFSTEALSLVLFVLCLMIVAFNLKK